MGHLTLSWLRAWLNAGRATPSVSTHHGIVLRVVPVGERLVYVVPPAPKAQEFEISISTY